MYDHNSIACVRSDRARLAGRVPSSAARGVGAATSSAVSRRLLVLAEEAAEAAGCHARGRRVQRRLYVARPVLAVPARAAALLPRDLLRLGRRLGELPRRGPVLVLPHHPRRPRPPERLARPLQPGHELPRLARPVTVLATCCPVRRRCKCNANMLSS
jgi:hypothetical protein